MEKKEYWKDVVGYEGIYLVSSLGRVKSLTTNKIMKDECRGKQNPYKTVYLSKKGKRIKNVFIF